MQSVAPVLQNDALSHSQTLLGSGEDKARLRNKAAANGLTIDIPSYNTAKNHTNQLLSKWKHTSSGKEAISAAWNSSSAHAQRGSRRICGLSRCTDADGSSSPLTREQLDVEGLVQSRAIHMDHTYKLLVIGDPGAGKTSLVQRYIHGFYTKDYKATLGGQERFTSMTRVYYRDAHACIIMFDVTQRSSFENAAKWKEDLDSKCLLPDGAPVPCILLGNKADLKHREIEHNEIEQFCREHDFIGWSEVSVKTGLMVEESISFLLGALMESQVDEHELENENTRDSSTLALSKVDDTNKRSNCACIVL